MTGLAGAGWEVAVAEELSRESGPDRNAPGLPGRSAMAA